ncbi:MAG: molybdenum cofactor guanylyltransferase [Acidobacteriota bacterium]
MTPIGVALGGGRSRRLGEDKALLTLPGAPLPDPEDPAPTLLQWAAERLAAACKDVLVADRGRGLLGGYPSVADGEGGGPAAGILGAADARPGRPLLVLACDLPCIPVDLLAHLADGPEADWYLPRTDKGMEPLVALYRPAALEALRVRVRAGRFDLVGLAADPGIDAVFLEGPRLQAFGDPETLLLNVNRPADLGRLRGRFDALRQARAQLLRPRSTKR